MIRAAGGRRTQLLIARFAGSAFQLLMTLALTRTTDPVTSAVCLVQFSWVQLVSAAIAWGHPVVVLRDASAHYVDGQKYPLGGHMRWAAVAGLAIGVIGTVVAAAFFGADPWVTALVGVSALCQALTRVTSQALKAFAREAMAIVLEFSLVPATLTLVIGVLALGSGITSLTFAITQAAASVTALILISLLWRRVPPPARSAAPAQRARARRGSVHYLGLLQLISIGTAQLPIVLAPALLDASSVAAFVVAFRVASLVTTVQNALNGYYGPSYARAFARSSKTEVARLLWSSQVMAAALCAPIVLVIPFAGPLLSLFGSEYSSAGVAYAILAIGQYINAVTGLVSYVLSLSHRESALIVVNVVSLGVLAVGWGAMAFTQSQSLEIYCVTFSLYLSAKNVVNYVLARRLISSM